MKQGFKIRYPSFPNEILKIGMILPLENPVNLVKIMVQTKITVQTTGDCGSNPRSA
jgi:hypothetical protein